MKAIINLLFISLLVSIGGKVFAQPLFTTYHSQYDGKTYDIQIAVPEGSNNKFTFYMYMRPEQNLDDPGGITVDQDQLDSLLSALSNAKAKFGEWIQTAKDNSVKDFYKTMNITTDVGGFFKFGDWQYQSYVPLTFDFKVYKNSGTDDAEFLLIVRTNKMQSSSNEFMKVDGFIFVFKTPDEIQSLLDSISRQKVNEYLNKPKTSDLFK